MLVCTRSLLFLNNHNLDLAQVEALSRQVEQLEQALQTTTRDYITGAPVWRGLQGRTNVIALQAALHCKRWASLNTNTAARANSTVFLGMVFVSPTLHIQNDACNVLCCAVMFLSRAARRDRQDAQDATAAAQAQMVSEVSAARSQLAAARRQARAEVDKAAAAADGKMREYVDKFREQVGAGRVWPASQSAGLHLPA